MDGALKKGVGLLVVVFLGFWLVQDPTGFGDTAQKAITGTWDLLERLFDSIVRFFQSLTN